VRRAPRRKGRIHDRTNDGGSAAWRLRSRPPPRAGAPSRGVLVETTAIGLLLLGLLLVFFHDALRPGTILAPADEAFRSPYFHPQRPAGWTHPANPLLFDQVYLFIPWRWQIWQALRQGRLPLWDPDSFCGTPLAGTMQAAVFYPLTWLAALLPFAAGFVASAIARLWIAGIGAYGLARRYGLGWPAALPSLFQVSGAASSNPSPMTAR